MILNTSVLQHLCKMFLDGLEGTGMLTSPNVFCKRFVFLLSLFLPEGNGRGPKTLLRVSWQFSFKIFVLNYLYIQENTPQLSKA